MSFVLPQAPDPDEVTQAHAELTASLARLSQLERATMDIDAVRAATAEVNKLTDALAALNEARRAHRLRGRRERSNG